MIRFVSLLALVGLAGCASIPKQQHRLSAALVGRPVSALVTRYGHPFVFGDKRDHYQWRASSKTLASYLGTVQHSQVTGEVDGRPFDATVTSPGPYIDFSEECILNARVDAAGVVVAVLVHGDPGPCRKFS